MEEKKQVYETLWPIIVRVYRMNPDRWIAEINAGWGRASGKTRNAAIDRVTKLYVEEQSRYFV